jgi:hypothetical protein
MSHGVSPGIAMLRCNPQPGVPYASEGTLVLYDGDGAVRLNGCKVQGVKEKRDGSGIVWEITIMDRRWKWRECGAISLYANQLDPNGKFIPWTVASPVEIAARCLQNMGESNFTIDLPVGLTSAGAAGIKEFLPTGINFPPSGVNPPIDWTVQKPMLVLEQLAEMFGRVVVYRWQDDAVWVCQRGSGGPLPPGSINSTCPGVDIPKTPDGVCVVGSATRYQADFEVMAVGEEWDGRLLPIDQLSYAPLLAGQKHKVKITAAYADNFRYYVSLDAGDGAGVMVFQAANGLGTAQAELNALATAIRADAKWNQLVSVSAPTAGAESTMEIEARQQGPVFDCKVYTHCSLGVIPTPPPIAPKLVCAVVRQGQFGRRGWSRAYPPLFNGVRATNRLTLGQARDLARKSVWRYFQLSGRDVSGKGATNIPGVGRVAKYQIVLQPEQCEQIVPEAPDFQIRDRGGNPIVNNFYNWVSKNKPAAAYGNVNKRASGLLYILDKAKGINTGEDEQIKVDFSVDPVFHCIKFSAPVFKYGAGGTIVEPTIRLRTACYVRDVSTNSFLTYQSVTVFGGKAGKAFAFEKHDDIQLNVIPTYNDKKLVTGIKLLEADPLLRGQYYMNGMILKYQVKPSLVNGYNGIVPIQLDGAISQITWNVSGDPGTGTETQASLNYEHNTSLPPYPARRRAELLNAAVKPGEFLGQIGERADPARPVPFKKG